LSVLPIVERDAGPPADPGRRKADEIVTPIPTRFVTSPDEIDLSEIELPLWTVYDRPRDFPDKVVVRLFEGKIAKPTNVALAFDTMAQARDVFRRWHFLTRSPGDDPKIVGTFI
jgi:hypothetical protein